jgi:ubiquinone/menaquinone biosynthesis C-methylase UbiE
VDAAYDDRYFSRFGGQFLSQYYWARRFYAQLVKRYGAKGGRLLEIGCGLGHALARLEDDFQTVGTDVSEYAVAEARKVATKSELRQLSAEQIDQFGPDAFDVILALHVFEHVERPEDVFAKCFGALRKDGALIMATPNMASPWVKRKGQRWFGYTDPTHISMHQPATWYKMLDEAGFTLQKAFGDGWWDVPYLPVIPGILQLPFFGFPAIVQTVTAIPFIPVRYGESLIVVARRPA